MSRSELRGGVDSLSFLSYRAFWEGWLVAAHEGGAGVGGRMRS